METAQKKHFDRDVWLRKALDVLFSHGIGQVKVEILARELNVTKGSFYWHFKNREELLHSMVDWWRNNQLAFINNIDQQALNDAQSLIKAVINFTQHTNDSSHDVAMREFARFDDYASTAISEVDQLRLDYLTKLFQAANFDTAEASLRARALYFYQVGEYTTSLHLDAATRDDLAERRFKLLICRPLDET